MRGMGRRDWLEDPDDRSWLDQLTGEIPRVDEPPPPPSRPPGPPGRQPPGPPGAQPPRPSRPLRPPLRPRPPGAPGPPGPPRPPGTQGTPGAQPPRPLPGEQPAAPEEPLGRVALRRAERLERHRSRGRRRRGVVVFLLLMSVVCGVTFQAYRLTAHRPPKFQPGLPEGFTVAQIVERIVAARRFSRAEVVKALSSPNLDVPFRPKSVRILEGLLFPQTYHIDKQDTPVTVLQQMLDQLETVTSRYDLRAAPLHLTPYQVLVVASIIEREAKVPADRPRIARVIYNRMAAHQKLQIDATVQYALGTSRHLTAKDLAVDSPYNTYRHEGLPPTPIAAPGEDSIRAALRPAAGPWRYYVLISKDGRHAFTDSAVEFARLKEQARRKGLL